MLVADNRLAAWALLVICISLSVMPWLGGRDIAVISLVVSLVIWVLVVVRALEGITALTLALLGFSVFGYFDIFKTLFIDHVALVSMPKFREAVYLIYIGSGIFLVAYMVSKPGGMPLVRKTKLKNRPILSSLLIITVLVYITIEVESPYVYLLSFIPKAFLLLLAWIGITSKRYWLIVASMVGMVEIHTEISRRVYIVIFFTLLAALFAVIMRREGKIRWHWKVAIGVLLAAGFLFVNVLRANFNYGEGYVEGDAVASTINYLKKAKAIDVFQNTEFVVRNYPDVAPYLWGESYGAIFVQFIPRSIWEGKWVSFGAPLALARELGIYEFDNDIWQQMLGGFSYSTGFWGEAFANFGWMGVVFLSVLAGFAAKYFDGMMKYIEVDRNPMSLCVLVFYGAFFLLARGDMLMATYFSILYSVFLYLIIRAYSIKVR